METPYQTDIAKLPEGTFKPSGISAGPSHYTTHPSGVECIQIVEHMNFNLGSAVRCVWRHQEDEIEDLRKARWYIDREISRLILKNEQ